MNNLNALLVAAHESRDALKTLRARLTEARSEYSEALGHVNGSYFSDDAKARRLERKELTERIFRDFILDILFQNVKNFPK